MGAQSFVPRYPAVQRPRLVVAFLVLAALAALAAAAAAPSTGARYAVTGDVDLMRPKDAGHQAAPKSGVNMTYHGGPIMPTAVEKSIFWGSGWATYTGDKVTGIDSFYTGFSGSHYAATNTEYTGSNGRAGSTTTYQGHIVDTSTASGGSRASTILAEVAKQVAAGNIVLDTSGNGYYPVYTDVPRGSAGYCAWHSAGTINGIRVQFAFFWRLDGDPGCDPGDTTTGHSQGLAALGNVSAHELSEAMTDPASPGGWYDRQGAENGDKCAWAFNVPSVGFSNGSAWMVQGEWSNAAYTAGTGYPNLSGQKGCLDGH